MEWRKAYLDLTLVPMSLLSSLLYHAWLWYTIKRRPERTYIAMNSPAQRAWINYILKDNDKRNVLAIQTLRNSIMGATLMATSSVLVCCGLLTFATKTYGTNDPIDAFTLGGNDELKVDTKCAVLLLGFLAAFLCEALSIVCLTQVNMLINVLPNDTTPVWRNRVTKLLGKGISFGNVGNRLFFTMLRLTLWIFGPIFVFASSVGMVAILYAVDIVGEDKAAVGAEERIGDAEIAQP